MIVATLANDGLPTTTVVGPCGAQRVAGQLNCNDAQACQAEGRISYFNGM